MALVVVGRLTDFPCHNDFIENGQRKGIFLAYDVAPTRLFDHDERRNIQHDKQPNPSEISPNLTTVWLP
jgi:hypothetical protein